MKTLLKTLSVIFALSLLFAGCKKDDEKVEASYFKVTADTSYALSWGAIYYNGTGDWSGYDYNIYLCSEGLSTNAGDNWSGSGDYFKIDLSTSSDSGIASGTYTFQLYDELTADHFDELSQWETGWNSSTVDESALASGTMAIVNKGNDNFEFTLNGTDADGNTVKMHFDGPILFTFNESTKKATNAGSSLSPNMFFGAFR
jgi:hypothetical protein